MQVSAADIVTSFRKRFGIRGTTDLDLSGSIIPVTSVGDLAEPPFHWKRGFTTNISVAPGGAGVRSFGILSFNSAVAQGHYCVTKIIGVWGAVSEYRFKVLPVQTLFSTYGLTRGGGSASSWDSGKDLENGAGVLADVESPIVGLGSASAAVSACGGDTFSIPITAALPVVFQPLVFVVKPNWALLIECSTPNLQLNASIYGDLYIPE